MRHLKMLFLIALMTSCKKSTNNDCRGNGGFVGAYYRVFYKTKDFGNGPVSIEVTSEDGSKYEAGKLTNYFPDGGITCKVTAGVVKVSIPRGQGITWRAYDAGKTWNGTVPASCEANSCEVIELK